MKNRTNLAKAYQMLKTQGFSGAITAAYRRVLPDRLRYYSQCRLGFESRVGLEIGGPSSIFTWHGCVPVYPVAARVDSCNFGDQTVWEGSLREGKTFVFNKRCEPGWQYIAEASHLRFSDDAQYDFVLSSHCIEHLANPLQCMNEWKRVLRNEGLFVLVVPHKDGTFDHRRPVTSMAHLMEDYENRTTEYDLTHLEEILELHDLGMDPAGGTPDEFRERSLKNVENRCLHQHVFDTRLAVEVVHQSRLQILAVELFKPYHIIVIARKPAPNDSIDNEIFRGVDRTPAWRSPFPSDRQ